MQRKGRRRELVRKWRKKEGKKKGDDEVRGLTILGELQEALKKYSKNCG